MVKNGMRPIHPGEILREEYMVPMGLSANALAHALGVTPARINDIVRERRGITTDTALRLARYFGTDAQSWVNLQTLPLSGTRLKAPFEIMTSKFSSGKGKASAAASLDHRSFGLCFLLQNRHLSRT